MKFNNLADRDEEEFTCIVSLTGSPLNHALIAVDTPFPLLPSFEGDRDYNNLWKKHKGSNKFNPKQVLTQFIYTKLGEPDDKSFGQQIGVIKTTKSSTGKLIKKYPTYTDVDFICAQVLSKVHDSVGGKMDSVTFSYKSNELEFNAEWHYGKNKFVVITD